MVQYFFIIDDHYYEIPVAMPNCQLIEERKTGYTYSNRKK
jgi:hypothetical protein